MSTTVHKHRDDYLEYACDQSDCSDDMFCICGELMIRTNPLSFVAPVVAYCGVCGATIEDLEG